MIEPSTRIQLKTALGVSAVFALGFAALFALLSVRVSEPSWRVESPEVRRARCAAAPADRVVLARADLGPIADGDVLAESATITPALVEGSTVGLELRALRTGSLYDRAGLCEGDVVTAVGGVRLDGMGAMLEAYERVQGQSSVKVELRRRGEKHGYVIEVR